MSVTASFNPSSNTPANAPAPAADAGGGETQQVSQDKIINALAAFDEKTKGLESELGKVKQRASAAEDVVGRIKNAVAPGEDKGPDPDTVDREFLDTYLNAALEAEKRGHPMPLTANLAVKYTEQNKVLREAMKTIGELRQKVEMLGNPSLRFDESAYAGIEKATQAALQEIDGRVDQDKLNMVGAKIVREVQRLQKDKPEVWESIRRSDEYQRRIARYFVEQTVPPKAREIIEREAVKNSHMTKQELIDALKEANQKIQDPNERRKITSAIRQQLWSQIYAGEE